MPVCHDPAFVFVHIPKCAGSSITDALVRSGCLLSFQGAASLDYRLLHNVQWLHHAPARVLREILPPEFWQSAFKFAVVRNPWARLVSFYHYRRRKAPRYPALSWNAANVGFLLGRPRLWRKFFLEIRRCGFAQKQMTEYRREESFSAWLERQLGNADFVKAFSCSHYACDRNGSLLVDEVFRQETLAEELGRLNVRLGLQLSLQRLNASDHHDYRSYYSGELRDRVASSFALDVSRFGD